MWGALMTGHEPPIVLIPFSFSATLLGLAVLI
jgi:hypothetical protein